MDFSAHIDNLPEMLVFIRKEGSESGLSDERLRRLELACEEALVNVISYAYPDSAGKVAIHCRKDGDLRYEVEIRDNGLPFDPIDAEVEIEKNKSLEERKVGGLGIFLIRKTVDETSYLRRGDENVLRLVLNLAH